MHRPRPLQWRSFSWRARCKSRHRGPRFRGSSSVLLWCHRRWMWRSSWLLLVWPIFGWLALWFRRWSNGLSSWHVSWRRLFQDLFLLFLFLAFCMSWKWLVVSFLFVLWKKIGLVFKEWSIHFFKDLVCFSATDWSTQDMANLSSPPMESRNKLFPD